MVMAKIITRAREERDQGLPWQAFPPYEPLVEAAGMRALLKLPFLLKRSHLCEVVEEGGGGGSPEVEVEGLEDRPLRPRHLPHPRLHPRVRLLLLLLRASQQGQEKGRGRYKVLLHLDKYLTHFL